jgi:hypothetical protein
LDALLHRKAVRESPVKDVDDGPFRGEVGRTRALVNLCKRSDKERDRIVPAQALEDLSPVEEFFGGEAAHVRLLRRGARPIALSSLLLRSRVLVFVAVPLHV